jgi:hypothetical protein
MVKAPGNWHPAEDQIVKSGSLSNRPVAEVAKALNRLEQSVLIRARVIGFPFAETGDA